MGWRDGDESEPVDDTVHEDLLNIEFERKGEKGTPRRRQDVLACRREAISTRGTKQALGPIVRQVEK